MLENANLLLIGKIFKNNVLLRVGMSLLWKFELCYKIIKKATFFFCIFEQKNKHFNLTLKVR